MTTEIFITKYCREGFILKASAEPHPVLKNTFIVPSLNNMYGDKNIGYRTYKPSNFTLVLSEAQKKFRERKTQEVEFLKHQVKHLLKQIDKLEQNRDHTIPCLDFENTKYYKD